MRKVRVVKFRVHDGSELSGNMRVVIRVGRIWRHFRLLYELHVRYICSRDFLFGKKEGKERPGVLDVWKLEGLFDRKVLDYLC